MEVHHHAHPAPPSREEPVPRGEADSGGGRRKRWAHYFWEFLMLFLAVFCGFLAENFREHKVEQHRAKEFARSLVQDLKNDTAEISYYRKASKNYISICDTLLDLNKARLEGPNATKFSFYTRFTYWTVRMAWNRTTFEQIKNSGSLRYFKPGLLNTLMKYDAIINDIERESINHETRGNSLLNSIKIIMDPQMHRDVSKLFIYSLDTVSKSTIDNFLSRTTPSLENKRNEIAEMLNLIVVQQRNIRFGEELLLEAENHAKELITEFKKAYHIK
jgi:hypothetical protein